MFLLMVKYVYKCHTVNILCGVCSKHLYYKYNYNPVIELLINRHIQEEQQAAQEYLNMAMIFFHPSKCLNGAGGFFMNLYNEELQHMLELLHYQIFRGGKPMICGLVPPMEHKNLTLLGAMKKSLDMEKNITKLMEEFVKVADELADYQSADFISSVFLTEQLKSIHEIARHVTKLTLLNDYEDAIYYYDLKLAKEFPYSFKTK